MNATVVQNWNELDLAEPGAILACQVGDGIGSLVVQCPNCGDLATIDVEEDSPRDEHWKLTGYPLLPTLDRHVSHRPCGWTGRLTNGIWK